MSRAELAPRMRELSERQDSFKNSIRLLWDPADGSVHLSVSGFDIEVPRDKANEAFEHPYPLLCAKVGEVAVDEFLLPFHEAAELTT